MRFKGVKTIGRGAHGFVQLALDQERGDHAVAIKYIPRRVGPAGCMFYPSLDLIINMTVRQIYRGEAPQFYKYQLREVA